MAPIPDPPSLPEASGPLASWDPFSACAYGGIVGDDIMAAIPDPATLPDMPLGFLLSVRHRR